VPGNPWGFEDVHGNVAEWCWDWYAPYPAGDQTDYKGPSSGTTRVIRGGYWGQDARSLRSANRDAALPTARSSGIGFRLVRTIP
jgi:formylglycine-generating enzyme required for sulfatase activity